MGVGQGFDDDGGGGGDEILLSTSNISIIYFPTFFFTYISFGEFSDNIMWKSIQVKILQYYARWEIEMPKANQTNLTKFMNKINLISKFQLIF